ncbi:hypothetical protein M422DRAFT_86439, partial [Sphaerobolus stellatus SS14]
AESDISRVQVERIEDWRVVEEKFMEAMMNTLAEKLAQSSSQHVREAVTAHLMDWKNRTFEAAKLNIRVNGRNLEDCAEGEEEEPFDEVLDRRIWTLSSEQMQWDKLIAERRREGPSEIEELVRDLVVRQRAGE